MKAEAAAHQPRQQQQHLVADQMTKAVVDPFEMVNVDDAQKVAGAAGMAAAVVCFGRARRQLAQHLDKALVEGLAVEQAGEGVAFAVVEQTLEVVIDPQHAADHALILGFEPLGGGDFQHADDLTVGGDREQGDPLPAHVSLHDAAAVHAVQPRRMVARQRQAGRVGPQRIGRGDRIADAQAGARQPALLPDLTRAAIDRHRQRLQQIVQRRHQGDIHDIAVTEAGQIGKMLNDLGHDSSL